MSTRNNPESVRKFPLLCYVTDRLALPGANSANSLELLTQKIEEITAAGVDWIQIREKDLTTRELADLTARSLHLSTTYSRLNAVRVIVNDRLDLALSLHAGGVHLGEKSLPVAEARRFLELAKQRQSLTPSFLIGASCHSLASARLAEREGADYVLFGPIFSTPSKVGLGAPQGVQKLAEVCRAISIPVLAIGGVTADNAFMCIEAGAAGIAAIRLFQAADNPSSTVRAVRQSIMDCRRLPPADQTSG